MQYRGVRRSGRRGRTARLPWPRRNYARSIAGAAPRVPSRPWGRRAISPGRPHSRMPPARSCRETGGLRRVWRAGSHPWARPRPPGHRSRARAGVRRRGPESRRPHRGRRYRWRCGGRMAAGQRLGASAERQQALGLLQQALHVVGIGRETAPRRAPDATSFLSASNAAMLPSSQPARSEGQAARHPAAAASAAPQIAAGHAGADLILKVDMTRAGCSWECPRGATYRMMRINVWRRRASSWAFFVAPVQQVLSKRVLCCADTVLYFAIGDGYQRS